MPRVQIYELVYAPFCQETKCQHYGQVFGDDIQDSRLFLEGAPERG